MKRPARRTQEQRREGTIRRLLDAAAEVLVDQGFAAASVQAICARAGVSQGGLFRHFPTREALMVAVGEDVAEKMLARYRKDFQRRREGGEQVVLALQLVRERCRSRLNQAWYELMVAARTQPALRRALAPAARRYYADIEDLARQLLPDLAAASGEGFGLLVDTVIAAFDGETLRRPLVSGAGRDAARLTLLARLASGA